MDIFKTLAEQRSALEAKLQAEKQARDGYALNAAGGDTEAQTGLEQAEAEIGRIELLLERNDGALRQAEAKRSTEGVARSHASTKAAAKRATQTAVERIAIARKLDKAFGEVAELYSEWRALGRSVREDFYAVCQAKAAGTEAREPSRYFEPFASAATAAAAPVAFAHALRKVGLNDLPPVSGAGFTFEDIAELAADKIAGQIARLTDEA